MAATKTFKEILRFFEDTNKEHVKATLKPYHREEIAKNRNRIHGEYKADHPWIVRLENAPGSTDFIATIPELQELIGNLRSIPGFTILHPSDWVYTIIYERRGGV